MKDILNMIKKIKDLAIKIKDSKITFDEIEKTWNNYYLKQFNQFENNYKKEFINNPEFDFNILQIMISHHNLDRLFEVLSNELIDKSIHEIKIPERIEDLVESLNEIIKLTENVS